jgi:NADH-quinone oxidoreductase subunit E
MLTDLMRQRFEREVAKYPPDHRQSAVIACLAAVQLEMGCITKEAERSVPDYLGMPAIAVHEVSTFYNMFRRQPVGRYKLNICTNLPCKLRDGEGALKHLAGKLGVAAGETTSDGMFTLQESECMGACADAPVLLVNDRAMCSFMTNDKLDELVESLRGGQE